ncbi:5-bromo-4-chloroindolyl phosphate hydrolysis family protein [Bacillus tianshenii]|nr:5-bromo-4-chloroindolyl phosphate hydrolysis family protein [Bacillus tianshenii]
MRSFLFKTWRGFVGLNASAIVSLVLWLGFEVDWLLAAGSVPISFFGVTTLMKARHQRNIASKNHLKSSEYKDIKRALKEAKEKLVILQRNRFKAKSVKLFKSVNQIYRYAKTIYDVVEKEPKRFYLANEFFYSNLDSAAEIVERYMFLSSQPVRDAEYMEALARTERMLKEMEECLERELKHVVSEDMENLDLELDVFKQSLERTSSRRK